MGGAIRAIGIDTLGPMGLWMYSEYVPSPTQPARQTSRDQARDTACKPRIGLLLSADRPVGKRSEDYRSKVAVCGEIGAKKHGQ